MDAAIVDDGRDRRGSIKCADIAYGKMAWNRGVRQHAAAGRQNSEEKSNEREGECLLGSRHGQRLGPSPRLRHTVEHGSGIKVSLMNGKASHCRPAGGWPNKRTWEETMRYLL